MPLVFNGTTIPTNVANALMYNGTSVTQVIFNGTTVWQQSLCVVCTGWSGSSMATEQYAPLDKKGIETSGKLYRFRQNHTLYSGQYFAGAWQNANETGFGGNSSISSPYEFSIVTSGWLISAKSVNPGWYRNSYTTSWVTWTPSTKQFSGIGQFWETYTYGSGEKYEGTRTFFETSGGLIKVSAGRYYHGSWISLT